MFKVILGIFREFKPSTIVGIVFETLILLGSFAIKYEDGEFEFKYNWNGLRSQNDVDDFDDWPNTRDKADDQNEKADKPEDKNDETGVIKGKIEESQIGDTVKLFLAIVGFFENFR